MLKTAGVGQVAREPAGTGELVPGQVGDPGDGPEGLGSGALVGIGGGEVVGMGSGELGLGGGAGEDVGEIGGGSFFLPRPAADASTSLPQKEQIGLSVKFLLPQCGHLFGGIVPCLSLRGSLEKPICYKKCGCSNSKALQVPICCQLPSGCPS